MRHKLRPALRHAIRRAGGGGIPPSFLLRDDFTTDEAAPLASPRTAEPGPGTLTITDTENNLSISGGALAIAGGKAVPAYGDPGFWNGVVDRVAGRALVTQLSGAVWDHFYLGYDNNLSGAISNGFWINGAAGTGNLGVNEAGASVSSVGIVLSNDTPYDLAVVMRSAGNLHFIRGGAFTDWTLVWVGVAATGVGVPAFANYNSQLAMDHFRVLDLPAPFDTDYGPVTQRVAGSVSAGQAFAHEADALIEFTVTTLPSSGTLDVVFRLQDATNYWIINVTSTGALQLKEVVAGVVTTRGNAVGVVSNGHRVVVVCDGTTIRGYSNNVLRWTYASAANFQTETDGEVPALGTGGAISNLVSWPRVLSGQAISLLNQAVA